MPSSPERRSLLGLDLVNFFVADVETGVGPLLATYLSFAHHWNPAQIGLILGSQKLAAVLSQTPAGWLVDVSRRKTGMLMTAVALLSLGCFFVVAARSFAFQSVNQIIVGAATSAIPPAIAAISLGMLGKERFSQRTGRNAVFSHAGNLAMASLAGLVSHRLGPDWIFYVCALMGCGAIASTLCIRNKDIDLRQARALSNEREKARPAAISSLWHDRRILAFAVSVVLFHVANSAMLPLAGQQLSQKVHAEASTYMSGAIVVSQTAMIPTSYLCGRWTDRTGRKPLFVLAFACLILRGYLFTSTSTPNGVLSIEILDGLGTALASVLTTVTVSDLAKDTGRFNLLGGVLQTGVSLGALGGNVAAGMIAKATGFSSAFLVLTAVALIGAICYAAFVPETQRGSKQQFFS